MSSTSLNIFHNPLKAKFNGAIIKTNMRELFDNANSQQVIILPYTISTISSDSALKINNLLLLLLSHNVLKLFSTTVHLYCR